MANRRGNRLQDSKGGVLDLRPSSESFRLPATTAAPRLARERVGAACAGLGDQQRAVAVLLTSELVANAVRHPPREESDEALEIEVRIMRTDKAFRVEVLDRDARPLPKVQQPTTPSEGGMGLYLVDELAAAWGSHPAPSGLGKVVWFEIWATGSGDRQ